jgi:hypothetical protein
LALLSVLLDAGAPIIGPAPVVHHGDDNDLFRRGAVNQRIGKPLETAPANVLPDLWPQFREIAKPPGRRYHLVEEIVAQAGYFRVVVLDRFAGSCCAGAINRAFTGSSAPQSFRAA